MIQPVDPKNDLKLNLAQTEKLNELLNNLVDGSGRQIHSKISGGNSDKTWVFHTKAKDSPAMSYSGSLTENALEAASFINNICDTFKK